MMEIPVLSLLVIVRSTVAESPIRIASVFPSPSNENGIRTFVISRSEFHPGSENSIHISDIGSFLGCRVSGSIPVRSTLVIVASLVISRLLLVKVTEALDAAIVMEYSKGRIVSEGGPSRFNS